MVDSAIRQYTSTACGGSIYAAMESEASKNQVHDEGVLEVQDTTCPNVLQGERLRNDDHAYLDLRHKWLARSGSEYRL
jgi:hypothetical protein